MVTTQYLTVVSVIIEMYNLLLCCNYRQPGDRIVIMKMGHTQYLIIRPSVLVKNHLLIHLKVIFFLQNKMFRAASRWQMKETCMCIITLLLKSINWVLVRGSQIYMRVSVWLFRHEVVGAFVEGQKSSCDIVLLTKCQNVPGVNVTDSRPYLTGYRHFTMGRWCWRQRCSSCVGEDYWWTSFKYTHH